jgi:hypothetical protein
MSKIVSIFTPHFKPLNGSTSPFDLNTHNFIEHITDLKIEENSTMGSFVEENLFTSTPIHPHQYSLGENERTSKKTRHLVNDPAKPSII